MIRLAALQRRFHDAITGRASLASARGLVRDDGIQPLARLQVYAHAYFTRIRDALAADYPKLAAHLGADRFTALVARYLEACPTRRPSLRDAGALLPGFLSEVDGGRAGARWQADLASLERARTEVFDGLDAPPLRRADLAGLAPDAFPELRLRLVPASAVVTIASNADEVWAAIEDDGALELAAAAPRTVLVWRRELVVVHRTLAADEAPLVRRLRRGLRFAELCDALTDRADPAGAALALLVAWLDAEILAGP